MLGIVDDLDGLIDMVDPDRFRESGIPVASPDCELTDAEDLWVVLTFLAAGWSRELESLRW